MKHFKTLCPAGIVVLFLTTTLFAQWEPDIRLTYDDSSSYTPYRNNARCIATQRDTIHIVCEDWHGGFDEIYYKRSIDGGITWGTEYRLTYADQYSYYPSVAISGNYIHVIWNDYRDWEDAIYYKRSTDGGTTWEPDIRLTNDPAESHSPSLAVSGTKIHVVWVDGRDGNWEIYYKRSLNEGTSWEADVRLTNAPAWSLARTFSS